MPSCKKCEKNFPNRIVIDGKQKLLASRKYCLDCSPYGKHNTAKLYEGDKVGHCKYCNKDYNYTRDKGHRRIVCGSCWQRIRRNRIKIKSLEYLGGKCVKCGYNSSPNALDFHHLEEDKKSFTIGSSYNLSWGKIKQELDKCEILCANCHREHHGHIVQ